MKRQALFLQVSSLYIMSTMSDEKCPVCHRLKSSGGTASITQWINTCVCNLAVSQSTESVPEKQVCLDCGKEIGKSRKGSLTQFVFRPDYCSCKKPRVRLARSNDFYIGPDSASVEEFDGIEMEIEDDGFPRERYAPVRIVGEGASGKIYLAWDRQLQKFVAVKVLNILSPTALRAFQGEARATSKLVHPSVVRVLDFGVIPGGVPYMVLEYFPGESLRETIDRESFLNWRHASSIIARIASTLSYCHGHGIFHGDLKPENILILPGPEGEAELELELKLVDFGLAKFVSGGDSELSSTMAGTPVYMCPDLLDGFEYDACAEVYSLGCIFFELLTGRLPYIPSGDTAIGQINLHVSTATPRVNEYLSGSTTVPDALEALVFKTMHKHREERFQSMEELASELENVFQDGRGLEEPVDESVYESFSEPVQSSSSSSSLNLVVVAVVALLFVGFVGFFWFQSALDKPAEQEKNRTKLVIQERPRKLEFVDLFNEIPEDASGSARMVTGKLDIQDEDLALLRQGLKGDKPVYLNLQGQHLSGEGFRYLAGLPIYRLNCRGCKIEDGTSRYLSRVKTLAKLHFANTGISDAFIDNLGASPVITWLSIGQNPDITGSCLIKLSRFPNLSNINIGATGIDDADLTHLISLKNLQEVVLNNLPGVSSRGIETLRSLPSLKFLEVIDNSKLDRQSLISISKMPGLHRFRFGVNVGFEPEDLLVLDKSPKLNTISVHNLVPIRSYLTYLLKLKKIQEYDLIGTDVTDRDLVLLEGVEHIDRLKIEMSPNVSMEAIKRLKASFSHPVDFKTDMADTPTKFGAIDELLNNEGF